jgi:hypothetical protein
MERRMSDQDVRDAGALYDVIGRTYAVGRRSDPRIAAQLWAALGDAETVLNVGAGTASSRSTATSPRSSRPQS